jgi:hypothetical protein
LIDHVLTRYHIPDNVKNYINSLYSGIDGSVMGPKWKSERFKFKRGVFQGDPLSPTIFICVFNPLLEYLLSEKRHGYKLNKNIRIISTPFTDDFNVITTNVHTHQRILYKVENFAKSMNLILEPNKCKSLSIKSGSSATIEFSLSDQKIGSIMDSPEKFLGSLITFRGKQSETFEFIHQAIAGSLANIDNSYIRNEYKLCVYSKYLLPAIRYKLTVHDLSVSHIYKETHAVSHASSRMKADDTVNAALESRLLREQEWTRKASTTADCEQQFMVATAHEPPAHASPKQQETIKSKIKKNISGEIQNMWRHHIKTLTVQGRFFEILALENSSVSWKRLSCMIYQEAFCNLLSMPA